MQKSKLFILVLLLGLCTTVFGKNAAWEQANQAYSQGQYPRALEGYLSIEKTGKVSADLYYNIGNTFFRMKRIGESILYFERALKMEPQHRDAKYNLEIAESKTIDRIEAIPDFFLLSWWNAIAACFHPSTWGILTLLLLLITGLGILVLIFSPSVRLRKWSFWTGSTSALLFLICLIFAFQTRARYFDDSEEIITESVVSVKGSPDDRGTNLFLLHEGTKVTRMDKVSHWKKIHTADGNEGWIESGSEAI